MSAAAVDATRTAAPSAHARLLTALRELEAWGAARDWAGPDPYDGLNATRLRALARTPFGRRVMIQLVKRSAIDLRPLLGIRPQHNAAAIANVVSAYARSAFLDDVEREEKLAHALDLLERLRLKHWELPCWGYHFDAATRLFFYPKTDPNTIATSFAGHALLDAFEVTAHRGLLEQAVGVGEFFLRHVPQTETEDGAFFGYLVGDRSPVHNASMLVCGLLARLVGHTGRDDFRRAAAAGVAYCLARQRPDGSWPYGERPNLQWVDSFHTGYVLEALLLCGQAELDARIPDAIRRGLEFHRRSHFLADGTAKYYATSTYPIDTQCVAQAIQTFALAASLDPAYEETAWRVLAFALRRLRRADGAFMFQRRRLWRNSIAHVRWVQAPMFLALTHLHVRAARR